MGAVVAFALEGIRQARHNHGLVRVGGGFDGLGNQRLVGLLVLHIIALGVGDARHALQGVHEAFHPEAVDMGAAAALEAGLRREPADHSQLLALMQGEDIVLVLEQHHALRGDLPGQGMLGFLVPGGVGAAAGQITVDHLQHPARGHIDGLLAEPAFLHSLHYAAVVAAAGGGHFQIQTGRDAGHAVAYRAPVAHDQPVKAPVLAEYACKQLAVLGSVGAV